MGALEIVEVALEAYRVCGKSLLTASAPFALLGLAGFMFFWSYAYPLLFSTRDPVNLTTQVGEVATSVALALFVAMPVAIYGASYVSALTTQLVSDFMLGTVPDIQSARAVAVRSTGKLLKLLLRQVLLAGLFFPVSVGLFVASALMSEQPESVGAAALTAGLGLIAYLLGLAFAPAVMVRDATAIPAAVIEGLDIKEATRRGRSLLGMAIGAPMIALVLIVFLFGALGIGLSALDGMLGISDQLADLLVGSTWHDVVSAAFSYVPWFLVIWVTVPIWSTVATIAYYERRVRLEGYDIEVLAQDVWRNSSGHRFQL